MSTTTNKESACLYSGMQEHRGIVFEIQAGRIDVGASIGFLSQYPHEAEYLMQPLSCLEVNGKEISLFELFRFKVQIKQVSAKYSQFKSFS